MKDLQTWIHSGVLEKYASGGGTHSERAEVEAMAMKYPEVGQAVDLLRREIVDQAIENLRLKNPIHYLESDILFEYVHGNLDEEARLEVELMAFLHPQVKEELVGLQNLDVALVRLGSKSTTENSKQRFLQFLEEETKSQDVWTAIHPPLLHGNSVAADYEPWVNRQEMTPPTDYDNLFLVPLDAAAEALTLLVWVKKFIQEEIHLDSVEKFLVLEGSCKVDIEGTVHELVVGQSMFVPKFMRHTVYVTSDTPCKLIVQQIAA